MIDRKPYGIVDVHGHVGLWPYPPQNHSFSAADEMAADAGIEICLVSSAKAILYNMQEGNRELFDELPGYPRFRGYVYVNGSYPEASVSELENYARHPQFAGLKVHGAYAGKLVDSDGIAPVLEALLDLRAPALVHTYSAVEARALARAADRFPGINFIMAHAGGIEYGEAIETTRHLPNVYYDFCSTWALRGKVEFALQQVGTERILFGSDLTLLNPWFAIGMIESVHADEDVKRKILRENAMRLFAFA